MARAQRSGRRSVCARFFPYDSGTGLGVSELYEQSVHVEIGVATDDLAVRATWDLTIWKLDATIGWRHRSEGTRHSCPDP